MVLAILLSGCSFGEDPVAGGGDSGGDGSGSSGGSAGSGSDSGSGNSPQLDIPPRQQWENDGGYCGETSIQAIGLYYGAWISQQVVRKVAKGELLIGVNEETALNALYLAHTTWDSSAPGPQFESFVAWIKSQLEQRVPVVYTIYLTDGINDPDYDHIVPATGIVATAASGYDAKDTLISSDNFGDQIERPVGDLVGTRASCSMSSTQGGCVPRDVDYGFSITGITDARSATLPVQIQVPVDHEPNISVGEAAMPLTASVTVSALQPGHNYALLRYDDYTKVPTNAVAADFLTSSYSHRVDFTADAAQWTYADPVSFPSSGATYYRCVPR
ncbi:MAG TPA: hypothetical protein VH165_10435 [Kofleriaceae bacterium]|nr:hypothetical protein [Kofleriaceae bacterium]